MLCWYAYLEYVSLCVIEWQFILLCNGPIKACLLTSNTFFNVVANIQWYLSNCDMDRKTTDNTFYLCLNDFTAVLDVPKYFIPTQYFYHQIFEDISLTPSVISIVSGTLAGNFIECMTSKKFKTNYNQAVLRSIASNANVVPFLRFSPRFKCLNKS